MSLRGLLLRYSTKVAETMEHLVFFNSHIIIVYSPSVKQLCVSNECISINDNLEVVDIGLLYKMQRRLATGETERENHSVWHQYKAQKDCHRKTEWKIPSDKRHDVDNRYRSQDHNNILDFTSYKRSIFLIAWMLYISHGDI
jgi:hypothetical protein